MKNKLYIIYEITEELKVDLFINNQYDSKTRIVSGWCETIRKKYSKEQINQLIKICDFKDEKNNNDLVIEISYIDFLKNISDNPLFETDKSKILFKKVLTFEELVALIISNIDKM